MRISNNLIVPKNLRGDPLRFFTSIQLQNINKLKGTFLRWNGFVFHVRGFGCVKKMKYLVLMVKIHCAAVPVHKKWTIQSKVDKKAVTVIVGLFFLRENAPTTTNLLLEDSQKKY